MISLSRRKMTIDLKTREYYMRTGKKKTIWISCISRSNVIHNNLIDLFIDIDSDIDNILLFIIVVLIFVEWSLIPFG